MLLSGQVLEQIEIATPAGVNLTLTLVDVEIGVDYVSCAVIKDSGDDPDVTNGIKVYAKARKIAENKLIVEGGIGIGRVSKKGLQVAVGEWAINPTPMKMIRAEVESVRTNNQGISIELSIPEGVEIAKKTFNERLGIIGGISVLGSSGIVVPMSEEAFKESLALELSVLKEKGYTQLVLTPGNYGQSFIAEHLPFAKEYTVTTSNFIGYMLHEAVRNKIQKVLLVGHIGKLVKVAGGIFHTHSSVADGRNEILAAHYMLYTSDVVGFAHIMQSNTTEEAIEDIDNEAFFNYLCGIIQQRCVQHVRKELEVEVIIFSQVKGMLGKTDGATDWLKNR
jgi:cobalt-precorrin-5B (C1)-methyltransferase